MKVRTQNTVTGVVEYIKVRMEYTFYRNDGTLIHNIDIDNDGNTFYLSDGDKIIIYDDEIEP